MAPFERFFAGIAAVVGAITNPTTDAAAPRPPAAIHSPASYQEMPRAAMIGPQSDMPPLPRPRPIDENAIVLAALPAATMTDAAAYPPIVRNRTGPPVLEFGPIDLRDVLARIGQAPDPLGFAGTAAPATGAAAAIDAFLAGGIEMAAIGDAPFTAPGPPGLPILSDAPAFDIAALPPRNINPGPARQHDLACLAQLATLNLVAILEPPVEEGACGIATPVEVAQIGTAAATVALGPAALVDCETAAALTAWLDKDVQPAAATLLGQPVTGIRVAAAYSCRGINNATTGPLSQHAYGKAIDISGFQLADGTWVRVHPYEGEETAEAAFLRTIRSEACGGFTTVLGPGVEYHDDHFHLDLAARNNDAVYCH